MKIITWLNILLGLLALSPIDYNQKCECIQLDVNECEQKKFYLNCYQNQSQNYCHEIQCQDIKNINECSNYAKCIAKNNICVDFTDCEIFKGKTDDECKQITNGKCVQSDGSNCQALGKCNTFKQQEKCTYGNDGTCIWNQNTCQLLNQCSQAQTKDLCNFPYRCIWDNNENCIELQCSMITHSSQCNFVDLGFNLYQVCQWKNNSCQEIRPQDLSQVYCTLFGNVAYHWNHESNYCEKCLKSNIFKPEAPQCSCESLSEELDCQQSQQCFYNNGKCQKKKCENISQNKYCRLLSDCAWYQDKCIDFTECKNYKGTENLECQSINNKCIYSFVQNTCTHKYQNCSTYSKEILCNGAKSSINQQCYWDYQTNSCLDWIQCEQQESPFICQLSGSCIWRYSKCQQIKCEDLNDETCKHYLIAPNSNLYKHCMYLDSKCQDLVSEKLTKEQCLSYSYGSSSWQQGKCQQCEISYIRIISISMLVTLLA